MDPNENREAWVGDNHALSAAIVGKDPTVDYTITAPNCLYSNLNAEEELFLVSALATVVALPVYATPRQAQDQSPVNGPITIDSRSARSKVNNSQHNNSPVVTAPNSVEGGAINTRVGGDDSQSWDLPNLGAPGMAFSIRYFKFEYNYVDGSSTSVTLYLLSVGHSTPSDEADAPLSPSGDRRHRGAVCRHDC